MHGQVNRFLMISFFKNFLENISPFVGPLIPLFWTSGDVSSGFQSQNGQPYLHLLGGGIYVICFPRFTSGVTPADLLAASMAAEHTCDHHWWGSNRKPIKPQVNTLPTEL